MKLSHVVQAVYNRPWYTTLEHLEAIAGIVQLHVEGGHLSSEEIRTRLEAAAARNGPRGGARTEGAIGVIPVYGTIMPRANLMTEFSGGATVSGIRAAFREALRDDTIGSILFDFDSPGGYTDGIEELATEIRESRGQKPIVAISDYQMASAAYYLGAQADEVVASPSSWVGWIGTVMVLTEYSKMDEMDGVTRTILRNPPGKYGGNPYEPLSDQARGEFQAIVDEGSAQFHSAVAKGRGISVATVKADFGKGGGMTASKAKAAGLVDRVESFDDTIRRLATGKGPISRGTSASLADRGRDFAQAAADAARPAQEEPDVEADPDDLVEPPAHRSKEAEAALALARARAR